MALHIYSDDTDFFIAHNLNDALEVALEYYGSPIDCELQEFPDDGEISIWVDKHGQITDIGNGALLALTAKEWCERQGRGFLCSTEY